MSDARLLMKVRDALKKVAAPGGGDIARTNPPFVGADGINFGAQMRD